MHIWACTHADTLWTCSSTSLHRKHEKKSDSQDGLEKTPIETKWEKIPAHMPSHVHNKENALYIMGPNETNEKCVGKTRAHIF